MGRIESYFIILQKELLLEAPKNNDELIVYINKIKQGILQSIGPFKKGGDALLSQFQVDTNNLLKLKN